MSLVYTHIIITVIIVIINAIIFYSNEGKDIEEKILSIIFHDAQNIQQ